MANPQNRTVVTIDVVVGSLGGCKTHQNKLLGQWKEGYSESFRLIYCKATDL
jgi:hypothetical protein